MAIDAIIGNALISAIIGRSLPRLERIFKWASKKLSRDTLKKYLLAETARTSRYLIDYLIFRYEEQSTRPLKLLRRKIGEKELIIPVVEIIKISEEMNCNEILGSLNTDSSHICEKTASSQYLKILNSTQAKVENNLMFELNFLEKQGNTPKLHCGITDYISCIVSQDEIGWELLMNLGKWINKKKAIDRWDEFSNKLTLRNKIDRKPGDWWISGRGRFNGIGISNLIIFKDLEGKYRVMYGKRSLITASQPDLFHVIPACMFQPEIGDLKVEWDIEYHIYKEYGEELFNFSIDHNVIDPRYFYTEWLCVEELRNALKDKNQAELRPTAIVLNLLDLRPEICTLLIIHDSNWWEKQMKKIRLNWEYVGSKNIFLLLGKAHSLYDIEHVEKQFSDDFNYSSGLWVPSGLASFWYGIDVARKIINIPDQR